MQLGAMQYSQLGMQSNSTPISIRPASFRPQITRLGCRCRPLIQRRPWKPVYVRAVSDRHRHAVDEQTGQNSGQGQQYHSPSHNQHSQGYEQHYGVPQYPGPPPQYDRRGSSGGGALPNLLWVAMGVVIATVVSKVYGVVSSPGGFQGWMMQQAMKAAMKGMPQPGQAGQPGQPPNPFAGMPGGFPNMQQGSQSPPGWPPIVDTTARPADQRQQQQQQPQQQAQASATSHQPPYNQDVNKGKRFQEHKQKEASKSTTTTASPKSTASSAPGTSTPPPSSFVDPPKQAASFTDVDDDDEASSSSTASSNAAGASTAQQSPFDAQAAGFQPGGFQQQQEASSSTSKPGTKGAVDVMEKMLKDPNMQKMLYPYLPEGMRNPQTFDWMMSNPEYRSQLEQMLEKQGSLDPKMMDALQGDANAGNWEEQLKALNMTPEEVIQKIMSDPELAGSFSKPEVQAAIMDCTQDPMNILKYQNNEEIMRVFSKMQELFPAQGPPGSMGPPGMPPQ